LHRIEPPSAAAEIRKFLRHSAIPYDEAGEDCRAVLAHGSCKWETVFRADGELCVVFGIYPFPISPSVALCETLNRVNAGLRRGGVITQGGRLMARTCADLFDAYSAHEAIARAVEYNAAIIQRYWGILSAFQAYKNHDVILKGGSPDPGGWDGTE
jgi:hypothetical protein